ncbi:multiple sugar transport system substrate-binding protein [Paenibacillus sp. UNCCL117]|uniref:ABC transporter substrate-binding protein n=1 Tax=unclassified Paenibacillus TaxID=185978 RepID=UPI0008898045|nr:MULTISPECIES: sugar ABC transporter substrate-binding protein [unclassified Paenibacillus]SDE19872.1 multiple sugar transport system substrate-binding protein [Paenibacillus sp. cl123]SFW61918.1 multiple sugar transport system substrate-binding protein [Paenibacillus sp. UNCCL117]
MKKMAGLGLGVALTVGLAGCGGADATQTGDNGSGQAAPPAQKKVVKYWTDDRHDQEYIKELINKFNSSNKDNIEVEMTVMSENYNQSVDIAFSSNQAPDVLRLKSANTETFYKKGYLAPLDSYLDDAIKTKFATVLIDGVNRFDGKLYSLPNTGLTLRLVYNKDLFTKAGIANPPQSLAEMVDAAKKITEAGKKDGVYGFALNFKNPKSAMDRSLREILSLSGHQGLGYDIKTGKFDFAPYGEAIKYFKQMYEDGSILPGAETLDIDPMRAQFAAGKIGMYLSFSTEPGVYKDQFPTQINWGGALAPTLDGKRGGTSEIVSAGTWLGLSEKSPNKDAAWKFIQFMYGDDVLTTYHEKGFGIAVVPSIAEKAKQPQVPGMEGFLVGKLDSLWPVSPNVTPEGINYADAFFKYMLTGGDLDKIVQDLNTRYNAALDKAVQKGDVKIKPDPAFDPSKLQGK